MESLNQQRQKSKIGQILLDKKLISQEQLEQAIREQGRTGQRLGEVLAAMQLITELQVRRAMARQRNLRLAAALMTSLLAPLQAYAALSGAPVTQSMRAGERSLRALNDAELGEVVGQARDDDQLRDEVLRAQLQLASMTAAGTTGMASAAASLRSGDDPLPVLGQLVKVFNPFAGLFGANAEVTGVTYDVENSSAVVNKDGSVTLRLPSTIGSIKLRNIRVGSATTGPSFGSLELSNIDLRGTTITVTPRITR